MQNHDILIQEIEGIDDYLGPTFRYVFFKNNNILIK